MPQGKESLEVFFINPDPDIVRRQYDKGLQTGRLSSISSTPHCAASAWADCFDPTSS